jgi:putative transposase
MSGRRYPTDRTAAGWPVLAPQLPPPSPCGRPRAHSYRAILAASFSVRRSGGAWRLVPHALPPWPAGYPSCRHWRLSGRWAQVHAALRARRRVRLGRGRQPRAGRVDSPSAKSTAVGGPRGADAGKPVSGRQRPLPVATLGLGLRARVHEAGGLDRAGTTPLLGAEGARRQPAARVAFPRLRQLWLASGYTGRGTGTAWGEQALGWTAERGRHPPKLRHGWAPAGAVIAWQATLPPPGVRVRPRRWVGERTCAWLGHTRRRSKDDERLCATGEALIYAAMSRLMARRLARA